MSSPFSVLQPSLCPGSHINQAVFEQRPGDGRIAIIPSRTVELQMPFGRLAWWRAIREPYLRGQRYGYGMDVAWTRAVGYELGTAIVNRGVSCSRLLGG